MALILFLLVFLMSTEKVFSGERERERERERELCEPFPVSQTRALKGLFAIGIIFHHLGSYIGESFPSLLAFKNVGYLFVGAFFFISGYGLTYGVVNKSGYMNGFLRRRFLPVFFTYTVIDLFYWAIKYICGNLSLRHILFSLLGLNKDLWFASVILWLYIIYFLCFRFLGKRGGMAAATAATVVYMAVLLFLHRFRGDMSFGFWWYNSIPCFALGMWYCAYREKLNDFIRRKQKLLLPLMPLLTAVLFAVTVINPNNSTRLYVLAAQILSALAFSAAVLVLSLRLRLGGPFLSLCGDLSLELYLFHAVFIYIWRSNLHLFGYTFYIRSDDIFFAAVLLWTFVASYVVHIIQKRIFKRNTEKNNRTDIFSHKKY